MFDLENYFANLDPDLNFFQELEHNNFSNHSISYNIDSYKSLCLERDSLLPILTFNIRSFNQNIDEFLAVFSGCMPPIIVFTETWFTQHTARSLPGYTAHHTFRSSGMRSGGVSVFVLETMVSFQIPELSFSDVSIEIATVNLIFNNSPLVIFGIYRPHSGTIDGFISSLGRIFTHESVANKVSLALGDFNLNLLDDSNYTNNFINFMQSFYFLPAITSPTRLFSVLDQIWFNGLSNFCSGLIVEHITDHFPTFIMLHSTVKSNVETKIKINFRCNHDENNLNK